MNEFIYDPNAAKGICHPICADSLVINLRKEDMIKKLPIRVMENDTDSYVVYASNKEGSKEFSIDQHGFVRYHPEHRDKEPPIIKEDND